MSVRDDLFELKCIVAASRKAEAKMRTTRRDRWANLFINIGSCEDRYALLRLTEEEVKIYGEYPGSGSFDPETEYSRLDGLTDKEVGDEFDTLCNRIKRSDVFPARIGRKGNEIEGCGGGEEGLGWYAALSVRTLYQVIGPVFYTWKNNVDRTGSMDSGDIERSGKAVAELPKTECDKKRVRNKDATCRNCPYRDPGSMTERRDACALNNERIVTWPHNWCGSHPDFWADR